MCVVKLIMLIVTKLGDPSFSSWLMNDEMCQLKNKWQLFCVIDMRGSCGGKIFGLIQLEDTNAITLRTVIEAMLANKVSISKLRGQGYDGATNM